MNVFNPVIFSNRNVPASRFQFLNFSLAKIVRHYSEVQTKVIDVSLIILQIQQISERVSFDIIIKVSRNCWIQFKYSQLNASRTVFRTNSLEENQMLRMKLLLSLSCFQMTSVISKRGTWGECNGDKKHCCFHQELNYRLNLGLKQR